MEVTLSRKWAKSRTRGRKLHLTGAKARVGRTRKTRADLEQQLKACRREIAHARERLVEAMKQQNATSEMLRIISNSPIQSMLNAVAENAARLCESNNAEIFRLENNLLRLVASYGEIPVAIHAREGLPANRDRVMGRAACDRRTIHVHDLAAEDSEYPAGNRDAKREGHRTTLATPLLREGTPIGVILIRRWEIRPFSDKQIALLETFADQAVIAIENVRLFEAEKQRTLALAQANRDLAERESNIRRLVEANIIGIFIWDVDGRIVEANESFLRLVQYNREDLVSGRVRWTDLTPEEWQDDTARRVAEVMSTGAAQPREKEYLRRDGSRVPVLIGGAAFGERLDRGIAFVLDVTERKRAEQALRRSEAYLAEAQRLGHSGVAAYNETTILYGSEEIYRIWGFDPAQGVPSREAVFQRVHPDDRDRHRAQVQHALREKRGYSIAYRIVLPDGTVKHLESIGQPVFSASGELVEVVATQIDVTERKRAEEALRDSEQALRRSEAYLADSQRLSHTGTWVLNPTTMQYIYWSDESYRIWGLDPLQGLPSRETVRQRIHPDDRDRVWEKVQEALRQKKDYSDEFRIVLPSGTAKHVTANSHHMFSTNGELVEVIGTSVDVTERKRAEEALREREAKIRRLVDANIIGIFIWDFDGRIVEANDAFLRLVGYDHADIVSGRMRWAELTPPEWRVTHEARLAELKVTGSLWPYEKEYFRKDGSRVPVLTGGATFEKDGNQGVAFVIDLTERKRAEEALRDSEEALRRNEAWLTQAQTLSHTGTWVLNPTTMQYIYWSDESYRIWGFDPLQGLPSREALWQRIYDRDRVWENVQEALRQKKDYSGEFKIVLPNGTVKYLAATSHHRFSTNGEIVEVIGTNVDVTERKRAEQALRESEAKFRDYAETASDWFWETGPDYQFTLLTENAFGSDSADRIGTACWEHALDVETEPEKWRLMQATLDSREPFRDFVYCSARRNGSPVYVKASGKPVFDANGEFRGYRGTGTDVTALMRAREEHERLRQLESDLAHMNRLSMMGELAASLAHEIAQPVAAARNNARAATHFLDRSLPDLGQVREALACVVDDADRAGEILDRIRAHIKKAPPRKERVDLNQAITDVIALAQGAIIKNGASVQTRFTEGLPNVQADGVQLQQVVLNLILNAVEAMSSVKKGARELSISTEPHHAGGVFVAVRDSGPGIAPEHLDRVFDAFYTTKSSGVGMGLSICRSIINAHGGRLWADVNASGGAVFQFTLPSAEKEIMNSRPAAHQTGEPNGGTLRDAPR
jgi:PAS domain S-box-containing protein